MLERNGYPVRRALDLASREVVEPALEQGVVDLTPEYLGTILAFVDPHASAERLDQAGMHARLQAALAPRGIDVLAAAPAANQNGLAVTRATAQRLHLATVSQLAPHAGSLVLGGPPECPERPYCLPGFASAYGLRFKAFRPLDTGGPRTVAALEGAEIGVGEDCRAVSVRGDGQLNRLGAQIGEDGVKVRMQTVLTGAQVHRPHGKPLHDGLHLFQRQPIGTRRIPVAERAREVAFVSEPKAERNCAVGTGPRGRPCCGNWDGTHGLPPFESAPGRTRGTG